MPAARNFRRVVAVSLAFAGGLWVCDRWMPSRTLADDVAPTSQPATTQPTLSSDAQAVVDRLVESYGKLPIKVQGEIVSDFDVAGVKESKTLAFTGMARSADAYRHEAKDQLVIASDGSKVHVYDAVRNQFADAAIAGEDEGAAKVREDAKSVLLQQDPAIYIALGNDPVKAVSFEGESVTLLEPTTVDGQSFDRLESSHDGATRQVWVDQDRGTISRVSYDLSKLIAARGAADVKNATITIRYTQTDLAAQPMADDAFAFSPPADATPMGAAAAPAGEPSALEGKPAPTFELKDAQGNAVKFEGEPGHVVVLDFWATWCPPCRAGLPHLAAEAKHFADKGVKVYAVNEQEDLATVKKFLADEKLDLTALLDTDGAVGGKYGVTGIPQTVVIDAKGVVRKVFVGFNPDDTKSLGEAIEAALK